MSPACGPGHAEHCHTVKDPCSGNAAGAGRHSPKRVKKLEIQPDKKVIITMAGGERQDMVREKEDTYKEADKNFLYKLKGKVAKQPTLTEADLDFLKANTGMTREEIKVTFDIINLI